MTNIMKARLRYCLYALLLLFAAAWAIYIPGLICSTAYFAFIDIKEDGPVKWVLGGELRTGLKALAWPVLTYRKLVGEDESWEEDYFSLAGEGMPLPMTSLSIKPIQYTHLLDYLKQKKSFNLRYTTESGTADSIKVHLNEGDGLVIERDVFLEVTPPSESGNIRSFQPATMIKAHVTMMDMDKDSKLDSIEINAKDPDWTGERYRDLKIDDPKDGKYTFLWEQSLGIVYRNSKCCKN